MNPIKATLVTNKNNIKQLYPKTYADMVMYDNNITVVDKINDISDSTNNAIDSIDGLVLSENNLTNEFKNKILGMIIPPIGNVDELKTEDNTTIADAINSLNDKIDAVKVTTTFFCNFLSSDSWENDNELGVNMTADMVDEFNINLSTNIKNHAFVGWHNLLSFEIPDNITSIGNSAFSRCDSLTKINIPSNIKTIGQYAFSNCTSLKEVDVESESLEKIDNYTFNNCSALQAFIFPNSLTAIGDYAFNNCQSLVIVELGDNITSIGKNAFYGCENISKLVLPDGITEIDSATFMNCSNLTSVQIPANVIRIGSNAFYDCAKLYMVELNNKLEFIDEYAFARSGVTSLTIPKSVTSISKRAFYNCQNLIEVKFDNDAVITFIADSNGNSDVFMDSSIKSISIPYGVNISTGNIFKNCQLLKKASIKCNSTIGSSLFENCSALEEVTIESQNQLTILNNVFKGCNSLKTITINAVTPPVIPSDIFASCNSRNLKIYVPESSIETYKTANVWSVWKDKIEKIEV